MVSFYAIKGIPLPTKPDPQHPIPLRKEFTAWSSDPNNAIQLSLFIQALIQFQAIPVKEKLSYYQISGIHGYPATSWDGEPGPSQWYCNHQKTTFPTWHRPYMLLFEQRMYEIMIEIVSKITPDSEKAIWEIEASHWRLPYWDWAQNQPYLQTVGIPQLFTLEMITVVMPGRTTKDFHNPLWKFSNPGGDSMGSSDNGEWRIPAAVKPWSDCIGTSRYGITGDPITGDPTKTRSQWEKGINNFQGSNVGIQSMNTGRRPLGLAGLSIKDCVSRMLSDNYLKSWRSFSSTLYQEEGQEPTDFLSIEQIHNNIHTSTGGNNRRSAGQGHMSNPAIAAFDPIFYLHHCNIDRQLAMWQTLNPDKWFDRIGADDAGPKYPLEPFHKSDGKVYESNDVRYWTTLGYQYDNLEKKVSRFLRAASTQQATEASHEDVQASVRHSVNMHLNVTRQAVLGASEVAGKNNDYLLNIIYDRYALQGHAYTLYFFIGSVPPSSDYDSMYESLPSYVGSIYTFSSALELSGEGTCQNCVEQAKSKILSGAQVPITAVLLDHCKNPDIPEFNTMDPGAVESYLTQHLTWRAIEAGTGRAIPINELPATKVYVMAGKAEHSEDPTQFSKYGDYNHMWGPTEGKEGGAVQADQGTHIDL